MSNLRCIPVAQSAAKKKPDGLLELAGPSLGASRRLSSTRPLPVLGRNCPNRASGKSRGAQRLAAAQKACGTNSSLSFLLSPVEVLVCFENTGSLQAGGRQRGGKRHGRPIDASHMGPPGPCWATSENRSTKPDANAAFRLPSRGRWEYRHGRYVDPRVRFFRARRQDDVRSDRGRASADRYVQ